MIEAALHEMASLVAAAVHHGWIPIEELLDLLDGAALEPDLILPSGSTSINCNLVNKKRDWALLVAQCFLNPHVAGKPDVTS